jgi:addiction module RelE/StbE family toxin
MCKFPPNLHAQKMDFARAESISRCEFARSENSNLHDLSEKFARAPTGNWTGYRECHIKPDLLLIYKKPNPNVLRLARLGSHSDLFG